MNTNTAIEWTEATWNPVTGCSKVSPGCKHCYAETVALRFWATQYPRIPVLPAYNWDADAGGPPTRPREFTDVRCHEDRLDQPLRWRRPRRIFVNSMSDLFHEDVPDEFIERVFSVMALAERHTFQVLTKRPERMLAWFGARRFDVKHYAILQSETGECVYAHPWPLPNVWLGVSVENQQYADERVPHLLQTPAAVRFLSCEPLLGHLNIAQFISDKYISVGGRQWIGAGGISWVIAGGESGPEARPCDLAWVRSIVAQCKAAGTSCFVKQLGAYPTNGIHYDRGEVRPRGVDRLERKIVLSDRKGGDINEFPADLRVRQMPAAS